MLRDTSSSASCSTWTRSTWSSSPALGGRKVTLGIRAGKRAGPATANRPDRSLLDGSCCIWSTKGSMWRRRPPAMAMCAAGDGWWASTNNQPAGTRNASNMALQSSTKRSRNEYARRTCSCACTSRLFLSQCGQQDAAPSFHKCTKPTMMDGLSARARRRKSSASCW